MNANVDLTGVVLETDRLIIREWSEMDLEDFFEYAKVDGVVKFQKKGDNKSFVSVIPFEA